MPKNPDYSLAQIYTIRSKSVNDDGWVYVGSSCRDLPSVFVMHMYESGRYPKGKSHVLYDKIRSAWDFYQLVLYENYPCENVEQLRKREFEVCELLGGVSIRQTLTEKKKKKATYYIDNREVILDQANKYYKKHAYIRKEKNEYFREYQREYRARKKSEKEQQQQ